MSVFRATRMSRWLLRRGGSRVSRGDWGRWQRLSFSVSGDAGRSRLDETDCWHAGIVLFKLCSRQRRLFRGRDRPLSPSLQLRWVHGFGAPCPAKERTEPGQNRPFHSQSRTQSTDRNKARLTSTACHDGRSSSISPGIHGLLSAGEGCHTQETEQHMCMPKGFWS